MILVTGASGNVVTALVKCLCSRNVAFRIGARKPDTVAPCDGVEIVALDFLAPNTLRAAVHGCDAVSLPRPPAISDMRETLNPFLDVAREEGVRQVVFLSVAGAATNPLMPHHAVEQHLQRESRGWTILRPGFFAQNFGDAYRNDIVRWGQMKMPNGAKSRFWRIFDDAKASLVFGTGSAQ